MHAPDSLPLGLPSPFVDAYDPSLLTPMARATQPERQRLPSARPFLGADLWTAYELSWLNPRGKPQVALAQFVVPCESVNLIESQSLMRYLGSFCNTRFADVADVQQRLRVDLSEAVWRGTVVQSSVGVKMLGAEQFDQQPIHELDGLNLDRLDLDCERFTPAPELLTSATDEAPVSEVLSSHLFKSNCPLTDQPNWASVQISYFGPQIEQAGLLRYLVSFRKHAAFQEDCVERLFLDISQRCHTHRLSVYARFTRRGGLDISPFRASHPIALPPNVRTARQ